MLLKREDRGEIEEWIRQVAQELGSDGEAAVANWRKWSDQEGELWSYGSGPKSWDRLAGECGWAIVQHGKVVDFQILAVN